MIAREKMDRIATALNKLKAEPMKISIIALGVLAMSMRDAKPQIQSDDMEFWRALDARLGDLWKWTRENGTYEDRL